MSNVTLIQKVAWYGTGRLGLPTLQHVASTNIFEITLLVRHDPASYSHLPGNIVVTKIDFADQVNLVKALQGHDAVVVFTRFAPYSDLDIIQLELINASIKAGVKFFIPSEWAPDTAGRNNATDLRIGPNTLPPTPVIAPKRVVHNYLLARSGEGKIDFATIHTGNMLLNLRVFASIDITKRTAHLPDGGQHLFSITSKETLGQAVVALLLSYPKVKNDFFYICDGETTLHEVVRAVESASGSEKPWKITSFSIEESKNEADENLRNGVHTLKEFVQVLSVPFTGGLTVWGSPDNERLGIRVPDKKTTQNLVQHLARCILSSKEP